MSSQKIPFSGFLKPREERYDPRNEAVAKLKRIAKIDFSGNIVLSEKPSNTDMIIIKKGDLVISGINVEKGAVAIYDGNEDIAATIHYSSYEIDHSKIHTDYLKWFLKGPAFIKLIKEEVPGGIKTEIKPKHLLPLKIDLPDYDEQIEKLRKLQNTEKEFQHLTSEIGTQQTLLKKLRQKILQDAVQGKLVAQDAKDEHASELVKQIEEDNKITLSTTAKRRQEKNLRPIKEKDIPFELPNGWVWCRLGTLIDNRGITYGIVKLGIYPKDGIKTIRSSDVKFRYIDNKKIRLVTSEISNQYQRTILKGGEILISVRGTLGGCALVTAEFVDCNISREVAMIPISRILNGVYLLNVLVSTFFWVQMKTNIRGMAYKGININTLYRMLIPLPPLAEQQRIVAKVEQLLQQCKELEKNLEQNKKYAEQLQQAVLQEAFKPKVEYKTPKPEYKMVAEEKE